MVIINMLDGEKIPVHENTVLVGINNASTDEPKSFYLQQVYIGNQYGTYEKKGSALSTVDERLGIGGFLLSHEMFSIGDSREATLYFTSAVKSISVV